MDIIYNMDAAPATSDRGGNTAEIYVTIFDGLDHDFNFNSCALNILRLVK